MNTSILAAAYIAGMLAMLLAMIDTMLKKRRLQLQIEALTHRLFRQRERIANLHYKLNAAYTSQRTPDHGHDAIEAVRLLLPLARGEAECYDKGMAAIHAGEAVIEADKRWHEREADTVADEIAANEL